MLKICSRHSIATLFKIQRNKKYLFRKKQIEKWQKDEKWKKQDWKRVSDLNREFKYCFFYKFYEFNYRQKQGSKLLNKFKLVQKSRNDDKSETVAFVIGIWIGSEIDAKNLIFLEHLFRICGGGGNKMIILGLNKFKLV